MILVNMNIVHEYTQKQKEKRNKKKEKKENQLVHNVSITKSTSSLYFTHDSSDSVYSNQNVIIHYVKTKPSF